jgi:hypothetical protein
MALAFSGLRKAGYAESGKKKRPLGPLNNPSFLREERINEDMFEY